MSAPSLATAPTQLLAGGRVVTPGGVLDGAWVQLCGESIASVGLRRPATDAPVVDLEGAWLLPGDVDVHMHGGGGHSVASSRDEMEAAVAYHRAPGLAGAALDAQLACELINDGRHLHPEVVRRIFRFVSRPLLITDAIDAADLVVLDDERYVQRVMSAGGWCEREK